MKKLFLSISIAMVATGLTSAQWTTSGSTITNSNSGDVKINSSSRIYFDNSGSNQGFLYEPLESSSGIGRYFLMFDFTNNNSYPFLTNRTPGGKVVIKTGTAAGGGENTHFTIEGGDGAVNAYFENTKLGIGTTSPLSPLHVVGDIRHTTSMVSQGATYSSKWMQFEQHQYGNSLILGSGGLTAIGSGESATQVKNNIGASTETLYMSSDNGLKILTNLQSGWGSRVEALHISNNGNIGLGTSSPGNKLEVNGIIRSKEVIVEATAWPDYVFHLGYDLLTLSEIEEHIKEKGHLPEVPSAQEVEEEGQHLGEMQQLLLKKIEEMTLLMIQQEKRIKELEQKLEQEK